MVYETISIKPGPGQPTLLSTSTLSETLTGHRTITQAEIDAYTTFVFDPGGAVRNVILPAEAKTPGRFLFIVNASDDTEVMTVQDDAAATVGTPTEGEAIMLWCDGTTWRGLVGVTS